MRKEGLDCDYYKILYNNQSDAIKKVSFSLVKEFLFAFQRFQFYECVFICKFFYLDKC